MSTKDFIKQYRTLLESFNDEFLELRSLVDQLLNATDNAKNHLVTVQDQLRFLEKRFERHLKNGKLLFDYYEEGPFKK